MHACACEPICHSEITKHALKALPIERPWQGLDMVDLAAHQRDHSATQVLQVPMSHSLLELTGAIPVNSIGY